MELLYNDFEKLAPTDLSAAEREAQITKLLEEDSRLREMALRMDLLFRGESEIAEVEPRSTERSIFMHRRTCSTQADYRPRM